MSRQRKQARIEELEEWKVVVIELGKVVRNMEEPLVSEYLGVRCTVALAKLRELDPELYDREVKGLAKKPPQG